MSTRSIETKIHYRVWIEAHFAALVVVALASCATLAPQSGPVPGAGSAPAAASQTSSPSTEKVRGTPPAAVAATSLPTVRPPDAVGLAGIVPPGDLPTPTLPTVLMVPAMPLPSTGKSYGQLLPDASLIDPTHVVQTSAATPGVLPNPAAATELPSPAAGAQVARGSAPPTSQHVAVPSVAPATASRSVPPVQPTVSAAQAASVPSAAPRLQGAAAPAAPPVPATPTAALGGSPASAATPTAATGNSPSTAASGAPPASSGNAAAASRTVYARVGDDITIALNGTGWTFTGGGATGDLWKKGVGYENRTADSSGTTFMFKAKALGTWTLDFQHQDAATGASSEESIGIHVLTGQQFSDMLASKKAGSSPSAGVGPTSSSLSSGGDLAAADWLYREGKFPEALDAYERAWRPDDPALTDKIAELAYRVGRYSDAHTYWQKNFGLTGTPYGELAVAGLMKTATAEKNAPELRALFDYVHALEGVPIRSELLATGEYLVQAKDWGVALRYLEEYLNRYKGETGSDVAEYLLGQIYQGDTPMQDAQKALAYYRNIVTYYPTSDYYERARENINYLNRHFFEIR